MSSINAYPITVVDAMNTMKDVDDCIKEIDSIIQRSSIMERQLIAQENYIEKGIIDYRIDLFKHRYGQVPLLEFMHPLQAEKETDIRAVSLGKDFSLILDQTGHVYSCGDNDDGELGYSEPSYWQSYPKRIPSRNNIIAISAGYHHGLVLEQTGQVFGFGWNHNYQLGHFHNGNVDVRSATSLSPNIPSLANDDKVIAVSAGDLHSLILTKKGKVYRLGWPDNNTVEIGISVKVIAISAGYRHSLILGNDGNVYSFGEDNNGRLGRANIDAGEPRQIERHDWGDFLPSSVKVIAISAGEEHSLILTEYGEVYGFGHNNHGQVGIAGNSGDFWDAIKIQYLIGNIKIIAISAGRRHNLVLSDVGNVYSFGDNYYGQLGLGDKHDRTIPHLISDYSNIEKISAGHRHSMIVNSSGEVYSFGDNNHYQLGIGNLNSDEKTTPQRIFTSVPDNKMSMILPPVKLSEHGFSERIKRISKRYYRALSAGGYHNFILDRLGYVYGFGSNYKGQLGLGVTGDKLHYPTILKKSIIIKEVSAGKQHTLILDINGKVFSFGRNDYYQLGLGGTDTTNKSVPTQIDTRKIKSDNGNKDAPIIAISAGGYYSLILTKFGKSYSFGMNTYYQLGIGSAYNTYQKVSVPTQIATSNITDNDGNEVPIIAISAGDSHSLVLDLNGRVYSFGRNDYGQLGNGHSGDGKKSNIPIKINTNNIIAPIIAISAGGSHSLVLDLNGRVYSFGRNDSGQLGHGHNLPRIIPIQIDTTNIMEPIMAISTGISHSLVLTENGKVFSFGSNNLNYQLGLGSGSAMDVNVPTQIDTSNIKNDNDGNEAPIIEISAGGYHSLVLTENGKVYSFGYNYFGQLGLGSAYNTYQKVSVPTQINLIVDPLDNQFTGIGYWETKIKKKVMPNISSGGYRNLILYNGEVYSFGHNNYGQLGLGSSYGTKVNVPTKIDSFNNIVSISAGYDHSLILDIYGKVYSFGDSSDGKLGLGDSVTTNQTTPQSIDYFDNIVAISAGDNHSLILDRNGEVYSFGANAAGRLGHGGLVGESDIKHCNVPIKITQININNIIAISAGTYYSLLLRNDGKVYGFGWNWHGQLGNGISYSYTNDNVNVPTQMDTFYITDDNNGEEIPIIAISAGGYHSLVLTENGKVYSFGYNGNGELGLGGTDLEDMNVPTKINTSIITSNNRIIAISAGYDHSLILDKNGEVYSFGDNTYYQLGLGSAYNTKQKVSVPTKIDTTNIKEPIIAISAGRYHSLVLTENEKFYSFGRNNNSQLGHGGTSTDNVNVPTEINTTNMNLNTIFNSLQLLPPINSDDTNDAERVVLTGINNDLEVFNGVDIMGTKQFLIGVNAILTHPNNITETLPPNIVVISPSTTDGVSGDSRGNWSWNNIASTDTWATKPWLDSDDSWAAKTDSSSESVTTDAYLELDLSKDSTVIGLVLQGRKHETLVQYVKEIKVKTKTNLSSTYSDVGETPEFIFNIEYAPWNSAVNTSIQVPVMFTTPVIARYVRIYPTDYNNYPAMRVGVMVQDKPYHPGMKQGLTTSILKGLLMQGNKNISTDASTKAIKDVIPDNGRDLDDAEIYNVTTPSNPSVKSIKTDAWRFSKPTFVKLKVTSTSNITNIDGDSSPNGNFYIAFSLDYRQYSLFRIHETIFTFDTALFIQTNNNIPANTVSVSYSQQSLENIRGFGLN